MQKPRHQFGPHGTTISTLPKMMIQYETQLSSTFLETFLSGQSDAPKLFHLHPNKNSYHTVCVPYVFFFIFMLPFCIIYNILSRFYLITLTKLTHIGLHMCTQYSSILLHKELKSKNCKQLLMV